MKQLEDRGYSIVVEYRKRVQDKRRNTETVIDQFFARNPDLSSKKTLFTAILPWVASAGTFKSDIEMLELAGDVARNLRTSEYSHLWFGTFSQINHLPDGTRTAWSNFVAANIQVVGNVMKVDGKLGTGEYISMVATVTDTNFNGLVKNITAGASFECEGTITDDEITASFRGSAYGRHLEGNAVLLR